MRIAYIVNQYPMVNRSFLREIPALERLDFEVMRFPLRGGDDELVGPEDRAECTRTRYLLRSGTLADCR